MKEKMPILTAIVGSALLALAPGCRSRPRAAAPAVEAIKKQPSVEGILIGYETYPINMGFTTAFSGGKGIAEILSLRVGDKVHKYRMISPRARVRSPQIGLRYLVTPDGTKDRNRITIPIEAYRIAEK